MIPSGSSEAGQASGQSSQTKDSIGMEPIHYNAAAKIEIEDIPKPLNHTSPIEISEDSKSESGEPAQAEVNIGMKADYYKGAAKGKIGVFKDIPVPLDQLLTPNRNTVLHIYLRSLKESESKDSKPKDSESRDLKSNDSKSGDSESKDSNSKDSKPEDSESPTAFVKKILRSCPSLLYLANVKGETPLHIAARYGHAAIVDVLIGQDLESGFAEKVKQMLEMKNIEKETALHEAVRGNHLKVVQQLIEARPDLSYSRNDAGETPLYTAVERNYEEVAFHILETCTSPAHDGPLGRSTSHAAVIVDNAGMIRKILERIEQQERSAFIKKVDKQCWTPLHCAAYFDSYGSAAALLQADRSIAYIKDAKGMTALHIAAHRGHYLVMEYILKYCPDCCELVDERGWNALHFAVNSSSSNWSKLDSIWPAFGEMEYLLSNSSFYYLLNEKDVNGSTPLHHHSKSLHYMKNVMCNDRVDKTAFNKQNLNAYDVALTSGELSDEKFMKISDAYKHRGAELRRPLEDDILPERKDYAERINQAYRAANDVDACEAVWKARKDRFVSIMKETSQYHLVVDTLIATVAFTAGLTMPGGFMGHDAGPQSGSPVLMRNAAFKAFIITNTIAMVQSCSAAFIQLFMPLLFLDKDPGDFSFLLASLAFCLSISAMGAMVLAFVMATYTVLMHSLGLAIANSVIGLLFFIPVFFVSIGCLKYLLEILRVGSSWILDRLRDFKEFLCSCILWGYAALYICIEDIFNWCRRY